MVYIQGTSENPLPQRTDPQQRQRLPRKDRDRGCSQGLSFSGRALQAGRDTLQEACAEDGIALLVHDQPAHQRHPRSLLGGHRGLFGRWQVRTHHHQEEPLRGHHPHQRGSTRPDRLQPRQAGNGIQGITAQLDPDLHERVDSFGWNHQEDHIPLL